MKIAIFSDCYLDLTGGIVSSINAQKSALENLGHTVYIFSTAFPKTTDETRKLAKNNIFVVPSCRLLFRGLTPVSRRPRMIERWLTREHPEIREFDVFYVHYESGCSIAGLRLAKKWRIPSVQVMHGREDMGVTSLVPKGLRTVVATFLNWFHSWYLPHPIKVKRDNYLADTVAKAKMWTMMVNHANYADYVITPSKHFRKKLIHYGVKKDFLVFPNGYPDTKFPKQASVKVYNNNEPLKIIWHARVSGEKRILVLLEALRLVKDSYKLEIYGGGGDLKKAQKYAKKYRLNATFYGNTSFETVKKAILGAHLGVLVSYNFDNYPMTLVEDEAAGVPVLICDPDMQEIVPRGGYLLSKDETAPEIANALNKIFEQPEQIEAMSKVMIKHRDEVLISRRIKLLEQIFNDIIKK